MATTNLLGNVDPNIDPATGLPKQKAVPVLALPTQNASDPNATVTLSKEAMSGAAVNNPSAFQTSSGFMAQPNDNMSLGWTPNPTPQQAQAPVQQQSTAMQGNQNILDKAQQTALSQPATTDLQRAYTQQAQTLAANPFGDWDPRKTKQAAMEKADTDWSNQFEAQRRQYGNVSGSGLLQENMLGNALQHNVDQNALAQQLDEQNYDRYLKGMTTGIETGQSVEQGNRNIFSQGLGNLGTVRGMAEGERAQAIGNEQQMTVLDKTFGQEISKMVQSQNWEGAQAALNRETDLAKQSNDIKATTLAQDKQNAFDLQKANVLYGYDMNKMIVAQDWQAGQAYLDRETQKAMQGTDIAAKEKAMQEQNAFDVQKINILYGQEMAKMVQNQDWTGGQAALDREAAIVAQSTDINAKNAFAEKQNAFDMAKLNATQDWQSQQNKIGQDLQLALQANDITATQSNIEKQIQLDKWKQTNGQEFSAQQNAINNALQVTLKTMDQSSAQNLMELKDRLDNGMLTRQQDFSSVQSDLDRQLELKKQSGDILGQKEIEALKGQIDSASQQAQREWNTSERLSSQTYEAGQTISAQQHDKELQRLDQIGKEALQTNDIATTKYVADARNTLEMNMQVAQFAQENTMVNLKSQLDEARATGDFGREQILMKLQQQNDLQKLAAEGKMTKDQIAQKAALDKELQNNQAAINAKSQLIADSHDVIMTRLQSQLDEAKANNDVGRQEQIIRYSTNMDLEKMTSENGFDTAKIKLQAGIDAAMKNGEYKQAALMQKVGFDFEAKENLADRALETMKIELEKQGINYTQLQQAIENGQIDPAAAKEFLDSTMSDLGISLEAPDPAAATIAAQNTFKNIQINWGLSHLDMVEKDADGVVIGLNKKGIEEFSKWYNSSMYEEMSPNELPTPTNIQDALNVFNKPNVAPTYDFQKESQKLVGSGLEGSPLKPQYDLLLKSSTNFNINQYKAAYNGRDDRSIRTFQTAPPAPGSFININGALYRVESPVKNKIFEGTGWYAQQFTATNINTGVLETIGATKGG